MTGYVRAMPVRRVVQAEALGFLRESPAEPKTSVITSLPDVSELLPLDLDAWRTWFVDAVRRVIAWVPEDGVAIFYQSDIRFHGRLVDKGHLIAQGAEAEGAAMLWHKIVCRRPPGTIAFGRPSYSHMICVQRGMGERRPIRHPGPDVIPDAGFMPWSRAMGVEACRVAVRFLKEEMETRVVVDPFCGHGTVLAVANAMGLDALGIDVGAKRCKVARGLMVALDPDDPTPT